MNMQKIPDWYSDYKKFIEKNIESTLDTYLAIPMSQPLEGFKEVIRYAFSGGKKLRAILALEFYLQLSGKNLDQVRNDDDIVRLCIAIEAIHAYSLVHDDLPCMDNDELRRGEPTVWKKHGEYNAVLVWDLLNSFCFELLSDIHNPELSQSISKLISHSVGFYGMIWGQVEDLYYEEHIWELDQKILSNLHGKKTWKLIEASVLSGVILSGETANKDIFWEFWRRLGLAFQIKDDLLDVEGTPEITGKSVGWEEKGFVYLLGVEKTREILQIQIEECRKIAEKLNSPKINFLVEYVYSREK
jgi:geranylgeranyl pyrophosphate synthase